MTKFKKISKVLCGIMVLVLATTLISGCSSRGNSAPKTLIIWGFDDEDVWKPIIKSAQANSLSGYDVKYIKKTLNDSYENDSLNSILSGQGPDVWAIPSDWVYRHKNKLAPMPDSVIKSSKLNLDEQYVPVVKESVYFDSKVYSLAPTVDTLMVYYNDKLLEQVISEYVISHSGQDATEQNRIVTNLAQPAATWARITESAKLITVKNGSSFSRSGIALGTSNNINSSNDILYALMMQNKTKMTSDDLQTATFNLPVNNEIPAKNALDFYTSFSNPSSPNYSWNSSMPNNIDAFAEGKVAMIIGYESLANYLSQLYPNLSYKKSPLPQLGTSNEDVIDFAKFTTFAVPKLSNNSLAAWQFVNYLSGPEISPQYAATIRVSTSAKKSDFKANLTEREFNNDPGSFQAQTAHTWVKGRYPGDADSAMRTAIDNVTSGKQDSKSALDLAASTITTLLRKTSW